MALLQDQLKCYMYRFNVVLLKRCVVHVYHLKTVVLFTVLALQERKCKSLNNRILYMSYSVQGVCSVTHTNDKAGHLQFHLKAKQDMNATKCAW